MRKTVPVLSAVVAVLLLSACTSAPSPTTSPTNAAPTAKAGAADCGKVASGSVSESVKVSGAFKATPKVTVPTGLKASSTERTIVIKGTGKPVEASSSVDVSFVAYSGTTGKEVSSTGYDGHSPMAVTIDTTHLIPGLVCSIQNVPLGSRVVSTENVKDAFGGADASSLGLKNTDSIVFVIDVIGLAPKLPTHATGTPVPPAAGFPTVKLAKDGQPTVTIPKTAPPAKTEVAVLKQGNGPTVASGDTVTLQYQGVNWRTGKVFDQSWGKATGPAQFPTTGVIAGFTKALVGQKVGSQVIAIVDPADGYGPNGGQPSAGITATDTIVFVIDILATAK